MTAHRPYFSPWRDETVACTCGWSGTGHDLDVEPFAELAEYSCPKCAAHLLRVSYPTADEIEAAAAKGNEEARAMAERVVAADRRRAEFEREGLHDPSQLPELTGDALAFVWDLENGGRGDEHHIISVGDHRVWREVAYYEDWQRFHTVKAMLKARYGERFRSLTATDSASSYLIGDNFRATLDPT